MKPIDFWTSFSLFRFHPSNMNSNPLLDETENSSPVLFDPSPQPKWNPFTNGFSKNATTVQSNSKTFYILNKEQQPLLATPSQEPKENPSQSDHFQPLMRKKGFFRFGSVLLFALCIVQAINTILVKKVSILAPNAVFTLMLIQSLGSIIGFGILWFFIQLRGNIDHETVSFRKWWVHLLIIGISFTLFNMFLRGGSRGNLVAGPLIVLITQLALPVNMLLSYIFLSKHYSRYQILAAFFLIGGVVVSLIPQFRSISHSSNEVSAIVLLLGSTLPIVVGTVYLEHQLKKKPTFHIVWGWFVLNLFEFLGGLPLLWAQPIFQSNVTNVYSMALYGFECIFVGINHFPNDHCQTAGKWWGIYMAFNLIFNMNMAYLVYHESSNHVWIASTASIPLAQILFGIPFLFGSAAAIAFHPLVICALFIVMISLIAFHYFDNNSSEKE